MPISLYHPEIPSRDWELKRNEMMLWYLFSKSGKVCFKYDSNNSVKRMNKNQRSSSSTEKLPEVQHMRSEHRDSCDFCTGCSTFVQRYGCTGQGLMWLELAFTTCAYIFIVLLQTTRTRLLLYDHASFSWPESDYSGLFRCVLCSEQQNSTLVISVARFAGSVYFLSQKDQTNIHLASFPVWPMETGAN